ncbi:valine--tRNA ligase [Candidatus Woesearchaeota archaeon]|nr:valine--tRNA ligase [Candidatus Woesearchaeota archaeon]
MLSQKQWTKEQELVLVNEWRASGYPFDSTSKKQIFSIDTPPPYVNAPVHIGHVTTYIIMDIIARFKRMKGFNVLFPLGLDRNGLPIEVAAEKKFGKKLTSVSRAEAITMCKKVLEDASLVSVDSFARAAISFNSWKIGTGLGEIYQTDSEDYRSLTQNTFIDMWHKGLIYEDARTNNYCPGCQTTIADSEIEYKDKPTLFTNISWKTDADETIIIGTTRPELLCSCEAILFHPNDERYRHLDGKKAIIPLYERKVIIKAHPFAEMEKGTGLVMMCSFGDYTDIRFFRDEKLLPRIAIDVDGRMNAHAGKYKGLYVKDARQAILDDLKNSGVIVSQKTISHRTPVCDRSNDDIEFIELPEFYVKQVEFKKDILELADKIAYYAKETKQILIDWINSVSIDWPISRRRYYATEVPVWHCKKCKKVVVPPKGKYYQPWKDNSPIPCSCGSTDLEGDKRVFDTWFDSSISPLYILQYEKDESFFRKNTPCSLRPQGKEIVRTWLYYTLLKCYLLTKKCIFKDAWIHHHILDDNGRKMSKREGNIIDPKQILEKFGAESLRLWAVTEGDLSQQDLRCSFERVDGCSKTITKFWNTARFVSGFPKADAKTLQPLDEWILSELDVLVTMANERFERYDFFTTVTAVKHFLWETFASHYLELVKNRAYNNEGLYSVEEQNSARFTLHKVLSVLCRVLAPVLPMMTYTIYVGLENKNIHSENFPIVEKKHSAQFKTEEVVALNSAIWKAKKDKGLSLKAEVKKVVIPEGLKPIEKDLKFTHNISEIMYGNTLIEC